MADRRTTVVIDVQIGDIIVSSGSIVVPAKVELDAKDESVKQQAQSMGQAFERFLTPFMGRLLAQQVSGFFSGIGAAIAKGIAAAGPALAIVGVAAGIVVGSFKYMAWCSQTVLDLFKQLVGILQTFGRAVYDANAAMVRFIAAPLRPMILGSVQALQWLVTETLNAGKAMYDLTERVLREAVNVGGEWEQQLANTATAMGTFGQAGMQMRDWLAQAAQAMTRMTGTMPTDAIRTMWDVASAGFSKFADLVNVSRSAITLSNATLENMGDTGRIVISMLNAFGLATGESDRVVNALAATAVKSATDIGKLIQSLKYVAPVAHQFGFSIEQTLAALGAMAQQGVLASQAGTGLRAMLFNLAAQTDKAHKAFLAFAGGEEELSAVFGDLSQAGMDPESVMAVRKQLQGIGKDLNAINPAYHSIVEIVQVFEKLTAGRDPRDVIALIAKAFNVRSAQTLMALLTTGSKGLRQMEQDITGTNLAYQMQFDQLQTLQGAMKILLNLWQVAQTEMFRGISPALMQIVDAFQTIVDYGSKLGVFTTLGATAGKYLMMLAQPLAILAGPALKAVAPLLEYLGRAFEFIGARFAEAAQSALPSVVQFFENLLQMVPRLAQDFMVVGEWLIGVGLPLFLQWAETVGPMLLTVFENIGNAVMQLVADGGGQFLIDWFQQLLQFAINFTAWLPNMIPLILQTANGLKEWAGELMNMARELIPAFWAALTLLLPQLQTFVMTYLPILRTELGYVIEIAKDFAANALPQIVTAFQTLQPYIISILGSIKDAIVSVTDAFSGLVKSIAGNAPQIAGTLKAIFGWLGGNAKEIISAVIQAMKIQMLIGAMSTAAKLYLMRKPLMAMDVLAAAWAAWAAIGGVQTSMDNMPKRAAGGPVSAGQTYIVGENGPETFTPTQSGYIIPNGVSGGPGSFTVICPDTNAMEGAMRSYIAKRRAQERHAQATYAANLA